MESKLCTKNFLTKTEYLHVSVEPGGGGGGGGGAGGHLGI